MRSFKYKHLCDKEETRSCRFSLKRNTQATKVTFGPI